MDFREIARTQPQRFEEQYKFPLPTFRLADYSHKAISIPVISGNAIYSILRQASKGGLQHNIPEALKSLSIPPEAKTIRLAQFTLDQLGLIYDYGPWGLVRIEKLLQAHGMELCPSLTGPILQLIYSDLIAKKDTLVLSSPTQTTQGRFGLVFSLSPTISPHDINIEAYGLGAFHHDTPVIVAIPSPVV